MTMPSRLLTFNTLAGATVQAWVRIHARAQRVDTLDALGDEAQNPRMAIRSARAEVRGYKAVIGDVLIDAEGQEWQVTAAEPHDSRYSPSMSIEIQREMITLE